MAHGCRIRCDKPSKEALMLGKRRRAHKDPHPARHRERRL